MEGSREIPVGRMMEDFLEQGTLEVGFEGLVGVRQEAKEGQSRLRVLCEKYRCEGKTGKILA